MALAKKPHIYKTGGYWVVSMKHKIACRNPHLSNLWDIAYAYCYRMNGWEAHG